MPTGGRLNISYFPDKGPIRLKNELVGLFQAQKWQIHTDDPAPTINRALGIQFACGPPESPSCQIVVPLSRALSEQCGFASTAMPDGYDPDQMGVIVGPNIETR
jgi:hypothetical protein